jgi:hypothetical protein
VIGTVIAVTFGAAGLVAALLSRRSERRAAARADVVECVHRLGRSTEGGWIHGGMVIEELGMRAYPALWELVAKGRLEGREGPTDPETLRIRGGRPRYFYRVRDLRRSEVN